MKIVNLQNDNRKFVRSLGNFHVLEYRQDASVSPVAPTSSLYKATNTTSAKAAKK